MLTETIETLAKHNDWRRGGAGEMLDPERIGDAIEHAITVLQRVENLIKQRGRYNTETAYKALETACDRRGGK